MGNGEINNGKKETVRPKTYFEELAELGLLNDLLRTRFAFDFENDESFHSKMLEVLYNYSREPVPEIEKLNLEQLCEAFSFFLEYTKEYLVNMDFQELLKNDDYGNNNDKLLEAFRKGLNLYDD